MNSDPQHFRTATNTFSVPSTFRYVSCSPANEAPSRSSAVALERTAEYRAACWCRNFSYAAASSDRIASGNGSDSKAERIRDAADSTDCGRSGSMEASASGMIVQRGVASTNAA